MKKAKTALLICDMMNTFDFTEAGKLLPQALLAAKAIAKLKRSLKRRGVKVIYVNDNFGSWLSDWKTIFLTCTEFDCLGKEIAEILKPEADDYFILKPKHSGFHSTALDVLLNQIGVKRLIITGIAGNICVLFTAHDAHMREFEVVVPSDCTASNKAADNRFALQQLKTNFGMSTPTSATLIKSFDA
ncbi:MAG: isochorismatase family cysteine hydrolase [Bdellovibrionota bacterium]